MSASLDLPFQLQAKQQTKFPSRRLENHNHRSTRPRRLIARPLMRSPVECLFRNSQLRRCQHQHQTCTHPDCPIHRQPGHLDQLPWVSALDRLPEASPQSSDFADLSQLDHHHHDDDDDELHSCHHHLLGSCLAAGGTRVAGPVRTRKTSLPKRPSLLDAASGGADALRRDSFTTPPPPSPNTNTRDFRDHLFTFRNLVPVLAREASCEVQLSPRAL